MLEFLTFLQEHLCKPIQDAYPCRGGLNFLQQQLAFPKLQCFPFAFLFSEKKLFKGCTTKTP